MIAKLKGTLISKQPGEVVIDCAGVGYLANVSFNTSEKLPGEGSQAEVLTYLHAREDALVLFGFAGEPEREMFRLLISISGIGPKMALGILSASKPDELREMISSRNTAALVRMPGIGKKTAERLVLELRDKLPESPFVKDASPEGLAEKEAVAALVTLGYNKNTAEKSVAKAAKEFSGGQPPRPEELIKFALKFAISG
jgi:Holliday junction DNA helicase RuvA